MKVLLIGGSRNIGYLAALRLLEKGATATFLLRNKSCFDADEIIKSYVSSGKVRLVQGDALREEDVRRAWDVASEGDDGPLDTVLFTVGGDPKFSLRKGVIVIPANLCAHAMFNLLTVFPRDAALQPNLVLVSSTGLGRTAHAALPFAMKPVYGYLLDGPHTDKLGMERAVGHAAGWEWPAADGEPAKGILPDGWQDRLGAAGWLKHVVVVRPAMFTDGACKGDAPKSASAPYRAQGEEMKGSYTISRKDVAHFIVVQVLADWQKWEGKIVRIAY